jgi:Lon-like ATP-dependent protease
VDWYSDVFDLIFPDIDPNEANNLWKEQLKEPEKKEEEGRMKSEELEENNAGY